MIKLMRIYLVIILFFSVVFLSACGKEKTVTEPFVENPLTKPLPPEQTVKVNECPTVNAAKQKKPREKKPTQKLDSSKKYSVKITTNCGSFVILLDVKGSPRTSASFASLVRKGFYNGLSFHRVSPGFVIQGGDPFGDGSGTPGYQIVEKPPANTKYPKGTVAMAKTGEEKPGTSGSQFFVVVGDNAKLDPEYAVLGKITSGLKTTQTISKLSLKKEYDGMPLQNVVIKKAVLTEK